VSAGALAVALLATGCAVATPAATEKYGGIADYLPKDTVRPDSELTGTAARPALTAEGDTVRVTSGGASALVTVTGPEVPGEGLPYQAYSTTCTWTVTVIGERGSTALSIADFTSIDHFGTVYRPYVVDGQPAVPATVQPGHTVTFQVRAVMRVGEGLMRWAPAGGAVVASWDFEVEND
jgi:hypothetical protein